MNLNSPTLAAVHVPEPNSGPFGSIQDALAAGYDVVNPVTGTVQIGVMIEGAFIPMFVEKASLVYDAIQLAKDNAAANPPPDPTPAETPTVETPEAVADDPPPADAPSPGG